jgi:hypothetical protein
MYVPDVAMQVWPSAACLLAIRRRTVVPKQEVGIVAYFLFPVFDPKDALHEFEVAVDKLLEALCGIIRKDYEFGLGLRTSQSPENGILRRIGRAVTLTRQWAQALVLYNALILREQMWHVR